MMDLSEVRRIVESALDPMATALWVRDWLITPQYGPLEEGKCGLCTSQAQYMRAAIKFDPAQFEEAEEVLNTLRHELLHLTHGEFGVYMNMMLCAVGDDDARMTDVEDRSYTFACERTVARWERLLDGLGLTPRVLAGLDVARPMECMYCGEDWKAIHPKETDELECPRCHRMTAVSRYVPPREAEALEVLSQA